MTNTTKQAQMSDEEQRQFDNKLLRLIQQHFPSIPVAGSDQDGNWTRWLSFARACSDLATKRDAVDQLDGRPVDKAMLKRLVTQVFGEGYSITPPIVPTQEERNFCPTCGKRSYKGSIHTCTPPQPSGQTSDVPMPEPVAWLRTHGDGTPVISEDFLRMFPAHRHDFEIPCVRQDRVKAYGDARAAESAGKVSELVEAAEDLCATLGECGMTERLSAALSKHQDPQ